MKPGEGWSNLHKKLLREQSLALAQKGTKKKADLDNDSVGISNVIDSDADDFSEESIACTLRGFGCFLCSKEDLPSWHFQHRGLVRGYRVCPTFSSAFWSLFWWHNESINIWSHYLCWLLVMCYAAYIWEPQYYLNKLLTADRSEVYLAVVAFSDPSVFASYSNITTAAMDTNISRSGISDHHTQAIGISEGMELQDAIFHVFLFVLLLLGSSMPAFLSAFCHQFYCISKAWHRFCWFSDFMGILMGMYFTGISFTSMAFRCHPHIWITLVAVLSLMGAIVSLRCWKMLSQRVNKSVLLPPDRFPEFSANLSMFAWFATLLPVLLACCLKQEYLLETHMRSVIMHSLLGPALMGMGVVVFAQGGFPERFTAAWGLRSGYFDFIGHSHQLWHLETMCLQFYWVHVVYEHYSARVTYGC